MQFTNVTSFSPQNNHEVNPIIISILYMRKPRQIINLPKFTELVSDRTNIWTQTV